MRKEVNAPEAPASRGATVLLVDDDEVDREAVHRAFRAAKIANPLVVATNGVEDLFGLDGSANIRFGLDYGLFDRLSIGIGRSRFDKLYDFRFKANLLRQNMIQALLNQN